MKEKPYVKVAMYALNIIFAIIIIVPVVYCFNVSMMDLKEIYGGKFWFRFLPPPAWCCGAFIWYSSARPFISSSGS